MIVVDANVLAFYLIEGERTADAARAREQDPVWLVPPLWLAEVQSILWKYVRLRGMPELAALELLDQAVQLVEPSVREPSVDGVLRDALRWNITVYDAQYISLARQLGLRCLTEDRALQKACPEIAQSLGQFLRGAGGQVREASTPYKLRSRRKGNPPS